MHGAYTEHCKNNLVAISFVNFYEKNSDRVEILGVNYEQAKNQCEYNKDFFHYGILSMSAIIYHNPRCTKSRLTLTILEEKGVDFQVIKNYEQADIDKIIDFTDTYMVNYPIILSNSNNRKEFEKFGKIIGLPTTYVYAPDGSLVDSFMGEVDIKTLKKATQQ
jgi:thiol-disulfide isomerase/thioredoxin